MSTHPAPARRGGHLIYRQAAAPVAAPAVEPSPPPTAPKAQPKPKQRTHRVEPREAPGWAAWAAWMILWAGGALASILVWVVFSILTTLTDGPLSFHGLHVANQLLAAQRGAAPLVSEWQFWLVFIAFFGGSNGPQWHIAFHWDEWTASPLQIIKLTFFMIFTSPFSVGHLALATLGGYALTKGLPGPGESFDRAWLVAWGAYSFFVSIIVQGVGTYRLRHMAAAKPNGRRS